MDRMLPSCDNASNYNVQLEVMVAKTDKKHKASVDFDDETYLRLMKVIGDAAHEGIKMSMRIILLGAVDGLKDDELLKLAKKRIAKEEKLAIAK